MFSPTAASPAPFECLRLPKSHERPRAIDTNLQAIDIRHGQSLPEREIDAGIEMLQQQRQQITVRSAGLSRKSRRKVCVLMPPGRPQADWNLSAPGSNCTKKSTAGGACG